MLLLLLLLVFLLLWIVLIFAVVGGDEWIVVMGAPAALNPAAFRQRDGAAGAMTIPQASAEASSPPLIDDKFGAALTDGACAGP